MNIKVSVLTSLYNSQRFLSEFFDCLSRINHTDEIELLLLHNQPNPEELNIIEKRISNHPFVKHIIIPERESLYRTWNRGVEIAKGKYLCVWNVDDIRLPDSIYEQSITLDKNPDAALTYGDFYYMYSYGKTSNDLVVNPEFKDNSKKFLRAHHIGCFPMWRKEIHVQTGYFDEQLFLAADFDFQIRLALSSKLVKTDSILGHYLENDPQKLSMSYLLQNKETNLLFFRYGLFDKINWLFIYKVFKYYKINYLKYGGTFHQIKLPPFFKFKKAPLYLLSIFKQPRYLAAYLKRINKR